jgi:hypothetical protein
MKAIAKGVFVKRQPTLPRVATVALALWALAGCAALPAPPAPAASVPPTSAAPVDQPTSEPAATADLLRAPTAAPSPEPPLQPYTGPLDLVAAQPDARLCEQPSPFELPSRGLEPLSFVPTGVCGSGEIGLFDVGDRRYLAQAAFGPTAFILLDVSDPAKPGRVGAWQWSPAAVTYDVKPFRQGQRRFLALAMESRRPPLDPCGIALVEVTNPQAPRLLGRYDGARVGADAAWCNVHTTEIDTDANGDATFLLASVRDTFDLRVLDIHDLADIREVGVYHLHDHPHATPPSFVGSFVHDTTIVGDRIYVAYWGAGVMILDKQRLEAGEPAQAVALNPPRSIAPKGFNVHHAYPTADGQFLFIEAEDRIKDAVWLFDIRDPARGRAALAINLDGGRSAPHNLLVRGDKLFVGWYNDGMRVFRYDTRDPAQPLVEPVAFQVVRAKVGENFYDGIWGMRVDMCAVAQRERLCVYASDMSLGVLIMAIEEP